MPELPSTIADVLEHRGAQERIWRASRIAWVGMGVAIGLAMAGLFGDGPLSHRDIRAPDGSLRLEYEYFQRTGGITVLVLHVAAGGEAAETQRICLERDFLDEWQVARLEPDSARQVITPAGMCLEFATAGGTPPPVRVWVQPQAMTFGARGTLRVADGAPLVMRAWVWP